MIRTGIDYLDFVVNCTVGCTPVSSGCKNCYANTLHSMRHKAFTEGKLQNIPQYAKPFSEIQLMPDRMADALKQKKPSIIGISFMGDLFHKDVPADFITDVYEQMEQCPQHTFVVCTKRPERIVSVLYGEEGGWYLGGGDYLHNVWHLTSVENQETADLRIPALLELREQSRGWSVLGISAEPLLGPLKIMPYLDKLDWVIIGGEKCKNARPMHLQWVRDIIGDCQDKNVPYYFKNWGSWAPAVDYKRIELTSAKNAGAVIIGGNECRCYPTHTVDGSGTVYVLKRGKSDLWKHHRRMPTTKEQISGTTYSPCFGAKNGKYYRRASVSESQLETLEK